MGLGGATPDQQKVLLKAGITGLLTQGLETRRGIMDCTRATTGRLRRLCMIGKCATVLQAFHKASLSVFDAMSGKKEQHRLRQSHDLMTDAVCMISECGISLYEFH